MPTIYYTFSTKVYVILSGHQKGLETFKNIIQSVKCIGDHYVSDHSLQYKLKSNATALTN